MTNLSDLTCNRSLMSRIRSPTERDPLCLWKKHFQMQHSDILNRQKKKKTSSENTTATPNAVIADVFKLTCYWGSGTSPPSWSWGHPQSWLHSHTEPQTESPLQGGKKKKRKKKSDVMVQVWKRWTVWMKIFIVVLIVGFVCLSNTWAAGHVMATRITAFFYLFWYFSNVTVYDINVYFYIQDTI